MVYFLLGKKFGNTNKGQKPQGKFQNSKGKFQKPVAGKFAKPIESKPAAAEKVDWNKFKQEKKDLKLKRKAAKSGFEQIQEAKQIYEKLKWYNNLNRIFCVVFFN